MKGPTFTELHDTIDRLDKHDRRGGLYKGTAQGRTNILKVGAWVVGSIVLALATFNSGKE